MDILTEIFQIVNPNIFLLLFRQMQKCALREKKSACVWRKQALRLTVMFIHCQSRGSLESIQNTDGAVLYSVCN